MSMGQWWNNAETRENDVLGRGSVTVPLCANQVVRGLTRHRTLFSVYLFLINKRKISYFNLSIINDAGLVTQ
jgi:hypothetical protein